MEMNTNSITYLNGEYLPTAVAQISPLDRGFIFGDGVYEVFQVLNGQIHYLEPHIERLNQSLINIHMNPPHSLKEWQQILNTLVEKNGGGDFSLYLQVTRGFEPIRKQHIPEKMTPTIFATCFPNRPLSKAELRKGFKAISVTDIRWKYCHIKTTARLAYILMFEEARLKSVDEGIIVHEGYALEGTSSNFFIVKNGVLKTPPKSNAILPGIIRDVILELANKHNISFQEIDIPEAELAAADELWISSSVRGIYPILEFNGQAVGSGKPGPVWEKMWDLYDEECNRISLPISH
jgi:D-alanine transaminase